MPVFKMKVIVWPINIGGDNRRVLSVVLCTISFVENIEHAFCVSVSFVGRMRWAVVHHRFVNGRPRAANFVWKDTGGQTGHEFLYTGFVGAFVDVECHAHVSVEEISAGGHVVKESANDGGEMNDMCRFIPFKDLLRFLQRAKVAVRTAEECPVLGRSNYMLKSFADEARTTCDKNTLHFIINEIKVIALFNIFLDYSTTARPLSCSQSFSGLSSSILRFLAASTIECSCELNVHHAATSFGKQCPPNPR